MGRVGWIKVNRTLLDWEWYDDLNVRILFLHLLLTVNHKDKPWRGMVVKKGSRITGRIQLSDESGLSQQQVRTALKKLQSTKEITIVTTPLGSIFTMVNWIKYQEPTSISTTEQPDTNQTPTREQPESNQRPTTTKEVNNTNKLKKERIITKELFEVFWDLYPKKIAKAKVKGKFLKLPMDDVKKILSTVNEFINYKPFPTYTHPNPETYINQRRWEDEIPKENPKDQKGVIHIKPEKRNAGEILKERYGIS